MHTTEEQARGKWCPMVREAVSGGYGGRDLPTAFNRVSDDRGADTSPLNCHCIASRCMMWRWQPSLTVNNPTRAAGVAQQIKREVGYCGLAGGLA